jgi:hypothetical protein
MSDKYVAGGTASCNEALAVDPRTRLSNYVTHCSTIRPFPEIVK